MTDIPTVGEKYKGAVDEVSIGKGDYLIGGAKGMPFLSFENPVKRRPLIAGEVWDCLEGYPDEAAKMFDGREKDPLEWAIMWKELGVDMICIRLLSTDPSKKGTSPEECAKLVKKISDATSLPIIVSGCGVMDIDVKTFAAVGEAVKDSRLIISKADEDDYKRLATVAIANNHIALGFSNLDVNLAKQMNILLSDFGVERSNMVMDPLMAPLGMGLDYSYSVQERIRIGALMGDTMLQIPMVCDCTASWDVGDASGEDDGTMGPVVYRAAWWEAITALSAVMSGADAVIVRGPAAADMLIGYFDELRGDI